MRAAFAKSMGRFANPYLLLTLCVLFWSGNFIVSRAAVDSLPPLALSLARWSLATLILVPWFIRPLVRQWALIRKHFWPLLLLALLGVTGFNSLLYLGLQHTTAINALLLQSVMPLLIIALNALLFAQRSSWREGLSITLSLLGVLVILGRGDLSAVSMGSWNTGDLWVLAAVLTWALYSIFLRWRPEGLDALAFLGFTLVVGTLAIVPFWWWEWSLGARPQWGAQTLLTIGYVALFPSVLSYLFWNRGVQALGANAAGHFIHLNPVFGSLLAIGLLGETFAWFHAVGALLVASAIGLSLKRQSAR